MRSSKRGSISPDQARTTYAASLREEHEALRDVLTGESLETLPLHVTCQPDYPSRATCIEAIATGKLTAGLLVAPSGRGSSRLSTLPSP